MTTAGMLLVMAAAVLSAGSNLLLRIGVLRAGGLGTSDRGLAADLVALLQDPLFLSGCMLYGVAALVWFRVISSEYLSIAYVLLVASTFILVAAGGRVFLHEPLTVQRTIGFAVILIGIAITAHA
jgi:multidrug transporter EmrE-like cation transporter